MSKTKKATFNLSTEVLNELDQLMDRGLAPSKNSVVEKALIKELNELRKKERKVLYQKAMKDPLFVKDIGETERDFTYADDETSGNLDK